VTLRYNTERPETVKAGKNVVAGVETQGILDGVAAMLGKNLGAENPFGNGDTGKKIVDILVASLD
jgi:UDP-N-acetylglucosamine 2-epimerase (non-hydrolysing)